MILNKGKILLIVSIFLISIIAISTLSNVSATEKTIAPNTPGGLKKAIETMKTGDTIKLKNGVYFGKDNTNIIISKSITIKGIGSKVILDGKGKNRIFLINKKNADVKLQNLKFRNGYVNGKFTKNTGGGAIYATKGSLTVSSCTFTNNRVDLAGGGAIAVENKKLNVKKSTFTKNRAEGSGAAIYFSKGKLSLTSTTFSNNRVKGSGGAIDSWYGTSTMNKCTFKNNRAESGGGAISAFYNKGSVTKCTFSINQAKGSGGAIRILGSADSNVGSLTVSGSIFTSNKASSRGGAIYGAGKPIKVINSNFKNNIAAKKYNAIDSQSGELTKTNVKISPKDGAKVK